MKLTKSMVLISVLAIGSIGFAQDLATDVGKGAKDVGKGAETVGKDTARGTEDVAKDAARATDKAAKVTAPGHEEGSRRDGTGQRACWQEIWKRGWKGRQRHRQGRG
jgi:hypothetical protein